MRSMQMILNDLFDQTAMAMKTAQTPVDEVNLGYCFMASTNDISSGAVGGTETAQVLISNPSLSGKVMRIFGLTLGTNVSTNNNIFRIYKDPTVTSNGTELTYVNMNLSGTQPTCKLYKVPTVSGSGIFFMNIIAGATTMVPINFFEKPLILSAGKKILIGVRPNTTGVTYSCNVFWTERVA